MCGRMALSIIFPVVVVAVFQTVSCETVYVSRSSCGQTFSVDVESQSVTLIYNGQSFGEECTFTFKQEDFVPDICVSHKKLDLNSCNLKIEYSSGILAMFPDETRSCFNTKYSEYCTIHNTLNIVFKKTGGDTSSYWGTGSDQVELKVFGKDDNDTKRLVKTTVYVIVGVVVGVIVIIIIITIIVVCVCCRKRRHHGGGVYHSPGQATSATTAGTYPMQSSQQAYQPSTGGYQYTQAGYPSSTTVYQHSPAGYQQYPPTSYQQHPPPATSGYPPASQQSYAGYQESGPPPSSQQGYAGLQQSGYPPAVSEQGTDSSVSEKPASMPSAPPMPSSGDPPPYPGY